MNIIQSIIDATATYMSARTKYILIAQELKEVGCTVKDVVNYLKKQARKEGYYSTPEEFTIALNTQKEWAKAIYLFGEWVKRNMNNKWELKKTQAEGIKKIQEDEAKQAEFEAMTPEEQAEKKESEKAEKALKAERKVAEFIHKNASVVMRVAEKEGFQTQAETILSVIKEGLEAKRIGI